MRTARPPFPRRAMKSYGRERIRTREALESSASSVSCHCPADGLLVQTARPPLPRLCPPPTRPTTPHPAPPRQAAARGPPICPITLEPMRDPVLLTDGHTYGEELPGRRGGSRGGMGRGTFQGPSRQAAGSVSCVI